MKILLWLAYVLILQVIEFVLWCAQRFLGCTAANMVHFLRTAPLSLAVSRVTPVQPNGKNSIFKYHFSVANIYLVISDDRAGKASHTPCYLIVCGFKRRQRSTSPRLASVFIRAVSNTKLCRPCVLKHIVEAERTSLRGPWSYFFPAPHKKVEF